MLEPDDLAAPHLRQLDRDTVAGIVALAVSTYGKQMPYNLSLELKAFAETCTRHDARRLANACQAAGAIGLAARIDDALLADLKGPRGRE